jgi:hypothetical protein
LEYIELSLHRERLSGLVARIRPDPAGLPMRKRLLKAELLPCRLDGIAFAAGGAGLSWQMRWDWERPSRVGGGRVSGKGAGIRKVLVVCPASLKAQWEDEIYRFSSRSVLRVLGGFAERQSMYKGGDFFTICNYEQVLRDLASVGKTEWDLLILDEAQRIKNRETGLNRARSMLKSRFLLVLTGTPQENSLGELYTLARLADRDLLGPAFRFFNTHKETDEKGKLPAWRGLNEVKNALSPVFQGVPAPRL